MTEGIPLVVLARAPGLVIRLGFSVLRLKRGIRVSARKLRKGLVKGGMSREMARKLACKYEEDLSFRKLMRMARSEK